MAVLRPLRALRYGTDLRRELPFLISPPGRGARAPEEGLEGVHPLSITQLTRGREGLLAEDADPPYTHAARLIHAWKEEGVLGRDPRPGFYLYEQAWDAGDGPLVRRGVVGLLRLEHFGPGSAVRPHERTMSRSRDDLVEHLKATETHLSLVMGLVADPDGALARLLADPADASPLISVTDGDGISNRVSIVTATARLEDFAAAVAAQDVVLADGHHRYEAAIQYQAWRRSLPGHRRHHEQPHDYVMALIVPAADPGLRILPTHRVLRRLPEGRVAELERRLPEVCDLVSLPDLAAVEVFLATADAGTRFAVVLPERSLGATVRPDGPAAAWLDGMPEALRDVEVAVLRAVVLRGVMGIAPDDFPPEDHVTYVNDARTAVALVQEAGHQVAFLVRPARPGQVARVSLSGEVMPPKSTNFVPKPAKGLLLNSLRAF